MKVIEVCDECTQNCVLIHGQKKDPSPVVISFLKLLYGNYDFSKFLYLPPEVSQKMSALSNQQNYDLEDSNGQRWTVKLANINNGLALDKGWDKFFTDHGLKVGDTLIFNYVIGSHFVVQIYGKTGCQKLNFPEANGNQRKRSKTKGKFRAEDGECQMKKIVIDVKNEKNRIDTATTKKIVKCPEAAYRNKRSSEIMKVCKKEIMEMNIMSSCKSMNSGKGPKFLNELGQSSSRAEKGETMKVCRKELTEMNKMSSCKSMNCGKDPKFFNEWGRSSSRAEKGETMRVCQKELTEMPSCKSMNSGKDPKFFNELGQNSSRAEKDNDEVFKVVKTEPVFSFNAYSPDTSNNSCSAVVGSQALLELPECLQSISFQRASRKVVFLRGPNTRFWPVIYQEKYGLKALASGWEAFCKSNSLRPGDECILGLENGPRSIYSVNIVRK